MIFAASSILVQVESSFSLDNIFQFIKIKQTVDPNQRMAGERRIEMPTYEYECLDCKKKFSVILSISEHEKNKASCPKCKGKKVKQSISTFTTKTSRKS